MIINELHITAFGGLCDRDITLAKGLNILEGPNESGKTSAAMFIKFIFYGLSTKSAGGLSERRRYVNLEKGMAAGYLTCTENGVKYRVERNLTLTGDGDAVRDSVRVVNLSDGTIINGGVPGEYFFGVGESMFVNTVFVGQLANVKPDGEGLGGAVENLLSAADENVNLKKAAERLNTARREIQHKNGGGGALLSLKEERSQVAKELAEASASSAELIDVEAALSDALEKKAQIEKKKERLDGVFKALDIILLKKKLDAVRQTEEKLKKLGDAVEAIDRSEFLTSYADCLDQAERDVRAYRETAAFYAEKRDYEINASASAPTSAVLEEAAYLDTKGRVQFAVGVALMVMALLGLVTAAAMYYFNTDAYFLPLALTLVFGLAGVAFLIFQNRSQGDLYALLDEWRVETIDDLEAAVRARGGEEDASTDSTVYDASIGELEEKKDAGERTIASLAESVGIPLQEDPCATAALIREYGEKLSESRLNLKAKMENFAGRLSVLREQVASVDAEEAERAAAAVSSSAYGRLALSLDTEGIKRVIRERDFAQNALQSQDKRVSELEKRRAEMKARTAAPAELAGRLEELDGQITELELKRDAYNLAVEALKKAGENMRAGVVPKLTAYASEIMSEVVNGRYRSLILDSNFTMNYMTGGESRSVEHMSKGTYDAAYLALRLALMRVVFRNAMPPVVLDESFAYIDETRFVSLLRCLSRSDGQSLFFTCREREAVAAHREEIGYSLVEMS